MHLLFQISIPGRIISCEAKKLKFIPSSAALGSRRFLRPRGGALLSWSKAWKLRASLHSKKENMFNTELYQQLWKNIVIMIRVRISISGINKLVGQEIIFCHSRNTVFGLMPWLIFKYHGWKPDLAVLNNFAWFLPLAALFANIYLLFNDEYLLISTDPRCLPTAPRLAGQRLPSPEPSFACPIAKEAGCSWIARIQAHQPYTHNGEAVFQGTIAKTRTEAQHSGLQRAKCVYLRTKPPRQLRTCLSDDRCAAPAPGTESASEARPDTGIWLCLMAIRVRGDARLWLWGSMVRLACYPVLFG
jgi:hypothetical protein